MKKIILTAAALLILGTTGATAQVIIGSTTNPHEFSILELVGNNTRGLRLPQMTTADRNTMVNSAEFQAEKRGKAQGLQIFNTTIECVEIWNGTNWIKQCGEYIKIPAITPCDNGVVPSQVRFAKYNLGADPSLNNPKKQMKYLTEHAFDKLDASVYGGLFQWGHKNHAHAVNTSNLKRYDDTDNAVNGQTNNSDAPEFYYSSNSNWYNGTNADKLWGNGVAIGTQTSDEGIFYNGNYYQKPFKTAYDPCPDGFRVPTQDEWEQLCVYDCYPNSAGGSLTNITAAGQPTGKGLTWVPVVCTYDAATPANRRCVPSTGWSSSTLSGYAVYDSNVWEAAVKSDGNGVYKGFTGDNFPEGKSLHDAGDAAPEPLLFLPAAGFRNYISGAVINTGVYGRYWSSTVSSGTEAFILAFYNDNVHTNYDTNRAHGMSIRCVAE